MNNPYIKTLEPVWRDTKDVWVNEGKLQELIKDMEQKKEEGGLEIPAWAVPDVQPAMGCKLTEWINFICWVNAINFAFTNFRAPWQKFIIEHPQGVFWQGSFALGASFTRALKKSVPVFNAEYMASISLEDLKRIFRPIDNGHKIPLIIERQIILNEVGNTLLEKYGGDWINLFLDAQWRAFNSGKGIVERLAADFPSFRDIRSYNGYILEFHKRAQLLVMMYHGRAVNSGGRFPLIKDIENIGPIADYEVPKTLHFLGVIEYSQEFETAIQNHKVFKSGDLEEVENRLAMSYVMKRLCDEVGVNMAQADYCIWEMGRKSPAPHILVPTTDY